MVTLRKKFALVIFSIALLGSVDLRAVSTKSSQLPEVYRHWLNEEVNYLITDAERDAFLQLKTNQDRDTFIDNFWRIRNPDPTAPSNSAKDEHYRRLAYANEQYGFRGADNGWRTDRGMVYITLGAPKQTARYLNTKYLRQMEIWFYQSPGPALPVYFSVIFYKPSNTEDFRLYSPYSDRPEKLINSNTAVNDEPRAIRIIREDTNDEVARLSLSLLPDEPVDLHEAYPSLQSDVLLSKIRNYRNLEENRRLLEQRKSLLEGVTHRILLGEQFNAMDVLATRDGENKASVHYLFRFLHPQDFALAQQPDGRFYYSINLTASLLDSSGKAVYENNRELSDYLSAAQVAEVQGKCFGIEGRVAAAPGQYQLRVVLTNNLTKQSVTQTRTVIVPEFHHALSMSQVMFLSTQNPERDPSAVAPFTFSGIRLNPIGSDNIAIKPGTPLRLVFQLWENPAAPVTLEAKKLDINYIVGHLSSSVKKQDQQTIDRSTFDTNGNLLVGKDIDTTDLPPGNYRLVVRVTDPET
ncbi:MAG TPA: GWxTD domain-containing protein, partial [Ktedonobacteraceae bacterium]